MRPTTNPTMTNQMMFSTQILPSRPAFRPSWDAQAIRRGHAPRRDDSSGSVSGGKRRRDTPAARLGGANELAPGVRLGDGLDDAVPRMEEAAEVAGQDGALDEA